MASNWASKLDDYVDEKTGVFRLPHDISPANLAIALVQGSPILTAGSNNQNFDTTVQGMALPKSLESQLLTLSATARGEADVVKKEIEAWFDDFMAQVQHWYARRAQVSSLIVGLFVAVFLNVDTIAMGKTLYYDSAKREAVVKCHRSA